MNKHNSLYELPRIVMFFMYFVELAIVNSIFYALFKDLLSPISISVWDLTPFYYAFTFVLSLSYIFAVWCRPITLFYRSNKRGSSLLHALVTVILMSVVFWIALTIFHYSSEIPSVKFLTMAMIDWGCIAIFRLLCRIIIKAIRSQGHNVHKVVFVGNSVSLIELYDEMKHPDLGYKILGYFSESKIEQTNELEHLGSVADVVPYLQHHNDVQQLYSALPAIYAEEIKKIIDCCEHNCVRFFAIPQLRTYLKRAVQVEMLGLVPVLSIREDPLSSLFNRLIKRSFDIVVSGLFMIPFWLIIYPIIAILTHFLQPGPVFFKQKRNGLNGEEFLCWKFRSMKVNSDSDKVQATKDDPRKTPFGNFMRKTSIDELPQFVNVFKGDMSIVGPRPHMVAHTEQYSKIIDKYMVRHWVRPGITGYAQVHGARGETKEDWQMEDRIRKDIFYIENWTFLLDLKIMFLTVWNVFRGDKQAY